MADLKLELQPFVARMVKIEKQIEAGQDIDAEEANELVSITYDYLQKYGLDVLDVLNELVQTELSKD
jgi:hypothetical protein